ncbi:MAG: Asp23/Gls24 family envelope stress response protein [Candidatus Omnitrophota bacterium]|nr:MAG: Asp23/Gls24 family envelope stress response protein [Candidatus Omnitrophota bacterium]
MLKNDNQTDLGAIKIHKNVIASIASLAATEIEGVKCIGTNLRSGIMDLFGKKSSSAINVEIDNNDEVSIEIPLIIKFGHNIPEVANNVQENIYRALEKMTNLTIKSINVKVQGIEKE